MSRESPTLSTDGDVSARLASPSETQVISDYIERAQRKSDAQQQSRLGSLRSRLVADDEALQRQIAALKIDILHPDETLPDQSDGTLQRARSTVTMIDGVLEMLEASLVAIDDPPFKRVYTSALANSMIQDSQLARAEPSQFEKLTESAIKPTRSSHARSMVSHRTMQQITIPPSTLDHFRRSSSHSSRTSNGNVAYMNKQASKPPTFANVYWRREVGTARPCFICNRETTICLATSDLADFVYTCQSHLSDRNFASAVAPVTPPASPAIPSPTPPSKPTEADIAKATADYLAKHPEAAKDAKKSVPPVKPIALPATVTEPAAPPAEPPRKFTLNRHYYQIRLDHHKRIWQTKQAREMAKTLPSAPSSRPGASTLG
ncbi:uncharacterized protein L969DRAFT_93584 [Mixia osmundae IAM 14324]|uniref:Uncharacterized protein n=1 Tax=Mixia osmundae (strain CBS 9802 / IAM 14324 / JCM 22182 / KY 12970) TaxID=764103 RepID=G7DUE2_MIXOS|nr:uncharacterized protein L969DRAFT_93584 [Mixia osmundae IAM 14324]KEI41074.1 hypothetical protein L969DRAFT_93584 [Mixia osmundae IAM 14324]GAA94202.1 hypothetical protein E5Q_00850 [Mixia osmundae IAM 14324]